MVMILILTQTIEITIFTDNCSIYCCVLILDKIMIRVQVMSVKLLFNKLLNYCK